MFHQGTCSKDKALNEAHTNHMEWEQEFAKNQSNSSSLGNNRDLKFARLQ